jgi:hypothetical protein
MHHFGLNHSAKTLVAALVTTVTWSRTGQEAVAMSVTTLQSDTTP